MTESYHLKDQEKSCSMVSFLSGQELYSLLIENPSKEEYKSNYKHYKHGKRQIYFDGFPDQKEAL